MKITLLVLSYTPNLIRVRVKVRVKIQPHANETKMQWGMSCEGKDCQNWKRNENNFVSFEATHLTHETLCRVKG